VVSYLGKEKSSREKITDFESAWNTKSFFRSLSAAFIVLTILSGCLNNKYDNGAHFWLITIIGLLFASCSILVWLVVKKRINESKQIIRPVNRSLKRT
jgi:hypothetical protein